MGPDFKTREGRRECKIVEGLQDFNPHSLYFLAVSTWVVLFILPAYLAEVAHLGRGLGSEDVNL